MKVKNITGTSTKSCKCGSWLQHWKNFSGKTVPTYCPVDNCYQTPTVGAHVKKVSGNDNNHYIIPMCSSHNASTDELSIASGTTFVSANKSETCEK